MVSFDQMSRHCEFSVLNVFVGFRHSEISSGKCSWSSVGHLVFLISSHFAILSCLGYVINIVKMHVKILSPSFHVSLMYPLGRGQPLPGTGMFFWNVRNSGPQGSSWKRRFSAWDMAGIGFRKWESIVICPLSRWPTLILPHALSCPRGTLSAPLEGTQRSPSDAGLGAQTGLLNLVLWVLFVKWVLNWAGLLFTGIHAHCWWCLTTIIRTLWENTLGLFIQTMSIWSLGT